MFVAEENVSKIDADRKYFVWKINAVVKERCDGLDEGFIRYKE